ncbi:MAG: hypothetical protein WCI51_08175 [Lentisphaerota bacterium]
MLKLGIIGINEGNGHPYSYTAVFNGYNEKALDENCPFEIIKKYLKTHHRNQEFIKDARVTHIWTQDRGLSENVASVSNIPHIANSIEDLIENVDAVVFARDDMWNHWEMAEPVIRTGKPLYMDKLLAHNSEDLEKFIAVTGPDYPLLTASSFRFAPEIEKAKREIDTSKVRAVHGMSPCVWVRYAPHLLDPVFSLFGRDIESVQNTGIDKADTVNINYENGLQVVIQVIEGISLPLGFTCYSTGNIPPRQVLYTDVDLSSYFHSIVHMMSSFTDMARNGNKAMSFEETVFLNRVVLAGIESRENNNRKITINEIF